MRIVALTKDRDCAPCRYRLAAFRPFLEAAGHELDIRPWPKSFLSRLLLRRSLRHADVLILQRKAPPAWQLGLFRGLSGHLIFDVDDAVFLRDSFHPDGPHSAGRARRFRDAVRAVDLVVAGNAFLREQAALWVDPGRVEHIPTCVDCSRYRPAEHRQALAADLVWIGSSSTVRGLRQLRPLLERVGPLVPGLRFKVICDTFIELRHMAVIRCPWSDRTEAEELATAGVGFSWMPDDLWSQGKCGLKVLQYMAAGLPVVANPIGVHRQLVRPGETGFLVETAEECASAVRRLRDDPILRRRLGQNARALVRSRFDVTLGARRWLEVLARLQTTSAPPRKLA